MTAYNRRRTRATAIVAVRRLEQLGDLAGDSTRLAGGGIGKPYFRYLRHVYIPG